MTLMKVTFIVIREKSMYNLKETLDNSSDVCYEYGSDPVPMGKSQETPSMCSLDHLKKGESAMVIRFRSDEALVASNSSLSHLLNMGLRSGQWVMILKNSGKGPLIIRVDNCRIALERQLASNVMVRRKNGSH